MSPSSSSDSEDDSFLNIAQKLASIINKGSVNNALTMTTDSPTSTLTDKSKKNTKSPSKKQRKTSTDSGSSDSIDIEEFRSAFPPLNEPKTKRGRGRGRGRKTNTRKRKNEPSSPNLADSQLCLPTRRKRSKAASSTLDSSIDVAGSSSNVTESTPPEPSNRGRGRGRGRGRNRNRSRSGHVPSILEMLQAILPTYSVGNTDEYPDQSCSQQLFGNTQKSDVVEIVDENDSIEDEEEVSVKVEWQSSDIYKFMFRQHQSFTELYDFFAKKGNVNQDKLLFTYNDKIIKPTDTPDSIEYSISKFIQGGIVKQTVAPILDDGSEVKDGIKLKFQCQNVKKPFETYIKPDDKMSVAMLRCAGYMGEKLDKLKFIFDGDTISGKSTPNEMELEGGECIDVKILS